MRLRVEKLCGWDIHLLRKGRTGGVGPSISPPNPWSLLAQACPASPRRVDLVSEPLTSVPALRARHPLVPNLFCCAFRYVSVEPIWPIAVSFARHNRMPLSETARRPVFPPMPPKRAAGGISPAHLGCLDVGANDQP